MTRLHSFSGIKWVRGELEDILHRVREALEEHVEAGGETAVLEPCVAQLGQVRGVLEMLQVYGAARLAEEMQAAMGALRDKLLANPQDAAEVLMLALIQLPDYLERLDSGQDDIPLLLLPAINDLRLARGEAPLTDTDLLVSGLGQFVQEQAPARLNEALKEVAGRLRPHLHKALLGWFRGALPEQGLVQLRDIFAELDAASDIGQPLLRGLFRAAHAVAQGLVEGSIPSDDTVKGLVGRLDRILRDLVTQDEAQLAAGLPQEVIKGLLYQVAQASSEHPLIQEVQAEYGLERPFPSDTELAAARQRMLAPTADALAGVRAAIMKELIPIKDALELFMRGTREQTTPFLDLEAPLSRLANILDMVGRDTLGTRLRARAAELKALGSGAVAVDEPTLMGIAEDLLYVESSLVDLGQVADGRAGGVPGGELRGLIGHALGEAAVDMAKAKDAILAYMNNPGDIRPLQTAPGLFHGVAGALRLIERPRAADLLDQVAGYIRGDLLTRREVLDQGHLDHLADAIACVEYYMEAVADTRQDAEDILERAQTALRALGAPLAWHPAPVPSAPETEEPEPESPESPVTEPSTPTVAEATPVIAPSATPHVDIDAEILDIFLEEAREEQVVIAAQYARWRADPQEYDALATFRRSFHTLKGSSRLVGVLFLGEFAWSIEQVLNRLIDQALPVSPALLELLDEAVPLLPRLVQAYAEGADPPTGETNLLMARARALVEGEAAPPREPAGAVPPGVEEEIVLEGAGEVAEGIVEEIETLEESSEEPDTLLAEDSELREIFETEALTHLEQVRAFLGHCAAAGERRAPGGTCPLDEELVRALHTLAGSARMAEVEAIAELAKALERKAVLLLERGLGADGAFLGLLEEVTQSVHGMLERLRARPSDLPTSNAPLLSRIETYQILEGAPRESGLETRPLVLPADGGVDLEATVRAAPAPVVGGPPEVGAEAPALDRELVCLFLEEAEDLLARLDEDLRGWQAHPDQVERADRVRRALHTLKGGARLAGLPAIGDLSHALETLLTGVTPALMAARPLLLPQAQEALDRLVEQVDAVRDGRPVPAAGDLLADLEAARAEGPGPTPIAVELAAPPVGVPSRTPEPATLEETAPDAELIGIFLEEAEDLLERLDEGLRAWRNQPGQVERADQVRRVLHTLKGGARLAGLQAIGDLSHALETLLTDVTAELLVERPGLLPLAQRAADRITEQMDAVRQGRPLARAQDLLAELASAREGGAILPPTVAASSAPLAATLIPMPREVPGTLAEAPKGPQPRHEQVRVRSDLLDRLVNNAGEISIYRARLEEQNTALGFNLGELEQTVARLHEQLRQMAIETEAQILYRFERDREEGRELQTQFDPLELDRFSMIQQLSRSLLESVNDLSSIRGLLGDLHKESETLLLQHSRITHELQDGLLRTRMVPFSHLVPRLHRLVRQTSATLNKQAELEVFGAEGEMDRNILERMVAPLEHILRNAISHGIEPPAQRRAAGKPEGGRVSLRFAREGNDVAISVTDDGAGLNLAAIRKRAVELGLLDERSLISDDDLAQMILEPGFSTAQQVTQISGRGVGTDVVVSEVKQLGGSLEIGSQPGQGTRFIIRLPFTLAISRALLVELGEDIFAVPHPTIEGVVRISASELAECHAGTRSHFSYAGHAYRVRYLGGLLGTLAPRLAEGRKWLPMLLVRTGEHRVAIQVDRIRGNQQIVVKSVGPQLSTVRWISGGTILADGRVVLILDVSALVRMDAVQTAPLAPEKEDKGLESCVKVMVVDDSITVRKVTTRLLRRHNMEVLTAKDGVDAVAQLQEQRPDLMLLDIEMPRMDGYELARHMRNTEELKQIPIIMITSRSGEKHKQLAMSLGVRRYLGKPYQESELLDTIYAVLAESET